ncbi:MAG: hypothetical protein WEB37_07420 [Bacteroidota bacterium]
MKSIRFASLWFGGSLFFALTLSSGCRSPLDLTSTWTASPVSMDGSSSDWTTLKTLESPSLSLGARNDQENLYLCFTTGDQNVQAQILFAGFTIWFPSSHEGARPFGIQFPLKQDRPVRAEGRDQFEAMFLAFEPRMNSLLVLEESDRQQFSVLQAPGIQVHIGLAQGLLVYELKVPIKREPSTPYAAVPTADRTIAVTVETSISTRDELPAASSRPGRSARRGPGGAPPTNLGGPATPEQLKLHAVIHLSQPVL